MSSGHERIRGSNRTLRMSSSSSRIDILPCLFFRHPFPYTMLVLLTCIELTYFLYQIIDPELSQFESNHIVIPDLVRTFLESFKLAGMVENGWSALIRDLTYWFLFLGTFFSWTALYYEKYSLLVLVLLYHCVRILTAYIWCIFTIFTFDVMEAFFTGAPIHDSALEKFYKYEIDCVPPLVMMWCFLYVVFHVYILHKFRKIEGEASKFVNHV